jgi:hypothetical protein
LAGLHLSTLHQLASFRAPDEPSAVFVSVDVEKYTHGAEILEVGVSFVDAKIAFTGDCITTHHFIVQEHRHLTNAGLLGDVQDRFCYGASRTLPQKQVVDEIACLLSKLRTSHSKLFLFGHSVHHDVEWLGQIGLSLKGFVDETCDIAQALQAFLGQHDLMSLASIADMFSLKALHLHNAGNDAHCTLQCAAMLMTSLAGSAR